MHLGDEVVVVTPVWPNLTAQPLIMGARLRCVSLQPPNVPPRSFSSVVVEQLADARRRPQARPDAARPAGAAGGG